MTGSTTQLCQRCRQMLPEGSNFCVSCGCTNDAAIVRQMNLTQAADDKIAMLKFFGQLSRIGGLLRFWK